MIVWVVNAGSSSLKLQILDMHNERCLARTTIERLGTPDARLSLHIDDHPQQELLSGRTLAQALHYLAHDTALATHPPRLCVHRIVHGGTRFVRPTLIDAHVMEALVAMIPLAPLHLPGNISGLEAMSEAFSGIPQAGVFDTAFHSEMPAAAWHYALPESWQGSDIRRFGFHGSSHAFVATEYARYNDITPDQANLVSLHLGNGASATAIRGGRSVDTSMGMTPLEGLVMGTRCGDIDPGLPGMMARSTGATLESIEHALYHESGLKGLCGLSDMRDIEARAEAGDERAHLAIEVFCHRVRRYLGAMMAVLGRTDGVVFTGGIGEHSATIRARVLAGLEPMGLALCPTRNTDTRAGAARSLHRPDGKIAIWVIPANEELHMAREAMAHLASMQGTTGR